MIVVIPKYWLLGTKDLENPSKAKPWQGSLKWARSTSSPTRPNVTVGILLWHDDVATASWAPWYDMAILYWLTNVKVPKLALEPSSIYILHYPQLRERVQVRLYVSWVFHTTHSSPLLSNRSFQIQFKAHLLGTNINLITLLFVPIWFRLVEHNKRNVNSFTFFLFWL